MNLRKQLSRFGLPGIVGALIATGTGLLLISFTTDIAQKFVHASYDIPYIARAVLEREQVTLVYMDDESYANLHQPFTGLWDRALHARLLDRLKQDGARAAAFDIVFSDVGTNAAANAEFIRAIKEFGKVILAADKTPVAQARTGVRAFSIQPPDDIFSSAAGDNYGTDQVDPDSDLIVRKHPAITTDDQVMPLSWVTADMLGASFTKTESERYNPNRWVNYYGPPGFLPNVSYFRALDTNDLKPGFFKNKIVFIGSRTLTKFAGERKDEYPSPYSFWKKNSLFMPGVEIQATMLLNLLAEEWYHRLPPADEKSFIVVLGILFGLGLTRLRPFFAVLAGFLSAFVVAAINYYMVTQTNTWFAWLIVVAEIGVAMIYSVTYNSWVLLLQKKLIAQQLGMYVSPALARKVEKSGDIFQQGAEKREVTILFSDIANFTAMCEGMDTTELQRVMNQYFENAVSKCIQPTDGMVIKFIGDAIFALWNTPLIPQEDHQERACRSALLFREYGVPPVKIREGLEVRTRIGLHTGVADVGNFGSTERVDYTAFGENINLSSRMEGLNKYLGSGILMTGETEKAVRGKFVSRFLGQFILKGFEKAVDVYELLGFLEEADKFRECGESYAAALKEFQQGNFVGAETLLQQILDAHPKDGPAKFLLKTAAEFRASPPETGWAGEIELKEK